MKKLSLVKRIFLIVTEPEGGGIVGSLVAIGVLFAWLSTVTTGVTSLVLMGLVLFALTGIGYLVKAGLATYDNYELRMVRQRAVAWVRSGNSVDEVDRRLHSMRTLGSAGALTAAGLGATGFVPYVNIDGTPMVNEHLDIHGNPFGVIDSTSLTSDLAGPDLGMGGGYEPPIGMGDGSSGMG